MVTIREAVDDDASRCSEVLCASITQLCVPDHNGDEQVIQRWTANKSPAGVSAWIRSSHGSLYVAETDAEIVAVGGVDDHCTITLNYVAPGYRFQGISKAVLIYLENVLRSCNVQEASLTSTLTARSFYRAAGWSETGEVESFLGMTGFTFRKTL